MKKGLSKSTPNSEKPARRKRKYDEEFKQQALAMVRNGQTARSVAQALGISENLIHRWKRASRTELPATEQEIEQLRRQLKQVEMERDILKKALSMCVRRRPACSVGDETIPPGK
jgi:transposase